MTRSLGRNWTRAAWTCAWLLLGGHHVLMVVGARAQAPEQHWQATPNYPQNNPPNYQPATAQNPAPAPGNPAAGPSATVQGATTDRGQYVPATAQYQNPQQPDQPIGPPQYPTIERRLLAPGDRPAYGTQPPDNRNAYPPQDPRAQGGPATGQPIQGPPVRNVRPQVPFVLSPQEAEALDRLLTDWEKRNKEIHVLESKFYRWEYDAVFGKGTQPPPPDEGILKFAAPDKGLMKIDAKDPNKSEQWLCDGKSIYQFDYKQHVVTEYLLPPELQGKGIGDGPLPFVFGVEAARLKQRYFMRIITPPNVQNEVWLEAYPRHQEQAAEFSKVQVILQIAGPTKALVPYAIQIFSPNGKDRKVYQLQDPKINPRGSWIPLPGNKWWEVSIPWGWTKKTDVPQSAVEATLSPSMSPQRR